MKFGTTHKPNALEYSLSHEESVSGGFKIPNMAFLGFYYIRGQFFWYLQHLTNFYGVNLCSEKKPCLGFKNLLQTIPYGPWSSLMPFGFGLYLLLFRYSKSTLRDCWHKILKTFHCNKCVLLYSVYTQCK